MFRVYKDFLRQMLAILVYYREAGYGSQSAYDYAYSNVYRKGNGHSWESPEELNAVMKAFSFFSDNSLPKTTVGELMRQIADQLNSGEGKNVDRDLIDTVVRILGLPYTRNVVSASTIQALQRAILLPEELSDLKQKAAKERYCFACGHLFANGEMATVIHSGDNKIDFCCTRCQRPSYIASDNSSKTSLPIAEQKALHQALSKKFMAPTPEKSENAGGIIDVLGEIGRAPAAPRRNQAAPAAARPDHPPQFRREYYADFNAGGELLRQAAERYQVHVQMNADGQVYEVDPPAPAPADGGGNGPE